MVRIVHRRAANSCVQRQVTIRGLGKLAALAETAMSGLAYQVTFSILVQYSVSRPHFMICFIFCAHADWEESWLGGPRIYLTSGAIHSVVEPWLYSLGSGQGAMMTEEKRADYIESLDMAKQQLVIPRNDILISQTTARGTTWRCYIALAHRKANNQLLWYPSRFDLFSGLSQTVNIIGDLRKARKQVKTRGIPQ